MVRARRNSKDPGLLAKLVAAALLCLTAGCDYARMTTDAAYDTYETRLPLMPPDSVSTGVSAAALRLSDPGSLHNPLQAVPQVVSKGRAAYDNFCIHCHGPAGNGISIVGQSFAPLPTDLSRPEVRNRGDGVLFHRIAFGFQRHPPLVNTMTPDDIWAVIVFMRKTDWLKPRSLPPAEP